MSLDPRKTSLPSLKPAHALRCLDIGKLVIGGCRLPVFRQPCSAHPEGLVWLVLICSDFHGAPNLVGPSGCYQFPRTSFRSFVIVALCPATTAGLLTAGIHQPLSTQKRAGADPGMWWRLGSTPRICSHLRISLRIPLLC